MCKTISISVSIKNKLINITACCVGKEESEECSMKSKKGISSKTHQLTFAWLHNPSTLLFPHSKSDTAAPCRVPSIPGWVSCLMRRLDCPRPVFPIMFFGIPALALSPLYSLKCSGWNQRLECDIAWISKTCRHPFPIRVVEQVQPHNRILSANKVKKKSFSFTQQLPVVSVFLHLTWLFHFNN